MTAAQVAAAGLTGRDHAVARVDFDDRDMSIGALLLVRPGE